MANRMSQQVTLQLHQILRLPRKMTLIIDPAHIWKVVCNARSNKSDLPTSPNTAPAMQNSTPKSKRYLPKTVEASFTLRGRSEHNPCMKLQSWTRQLGELILFPPLATHFVSKITTCRGPAISIQISPNAAPATESDTPRSPTAAPATKGDTPTAANAAPATKSETPTSPNTAPATQNAWHDWSCYDKWDVSDVWWQM